MNWLQESVSFLIPMIILLGLLIFVHELGHFLVAKYYKVRVEVFSLGFGPKIFKFKKGETTYAISAIPLGGYVKMYGDDPTAEVPDDLKAVSFTHKPVGQRIAIVLAGPLMNFFFAIVVFAMVALVGEPVLSSKIGDITPGTPAYEAGFRSGDVITKVAGEPVQSWEDVQKRIEARADQHVTFDVTRGDAPMTITATPKLVRNKNILSWEKLVGEIDGLSYSSRASIVGVSDPASAAAQSGLQTGDIITAVDGKKVGMWREFTQELSQRVNASNSAPPETIKLSVNRFANLEDTSKEPESLEVTLQVPPTAASKTGDELLQALGVEWPETFIASFDKKSPAKAAGLQSRDKIIAIDGKPVTTFDDIAHQIRSYDPGTTQAAVEGPAAEDAKSRPLNITIVRAGQKMDIPVTPTFKERPNKHGKEEQRFEIGFSPLIDNAAPSTFVMETSNPVAALQHGVKQTVRWTNLTVLSFVRLFQAEVSAKNVGGFISIGMMAKKSWQSGASQFLNVMAIISINLFILNLLPVPVLDGGHLVFFSIEALRGAPLSMRKLEIAQQVGLILLLGLMVFALFNDVTRWLN